MANGSWFDCDVRGKHSALANQGQGSEAKPMGGKGGRDSRWLSWGKHWRRKRRRRGGGGKLGIEEKE